MKPGRTLVVFAKAPVLGRVKTRLATDIGAGAATAFYRHATAGLLRRVGCDPRWRTVLAVSPDTAAGEDWPAWSAAPVRRPQGDGDLGRRMARALAAAAPGPAVIVGSDIPGIGPADVAAAFEALRRADLVVGPAEDGGYWAIGAAGGARGGAGLPPRLFEAVRWSGPHALADTVRSAGPARVAYLRPLPDIDTGPDWHRWRASL